MFVIEVAHEASPVTPSRAGAYLEMSTRNTSDSVRYKSDIVEHLTGLGFPAKDANLAVDETLRAIQAMLVDGDEVQLTGFGKFETKFKPATTRKVFKDVKNIPAKTVAVFKPGKNLRDAVNGD